jgi:hypothetical protein
MSVRTIPLILLQASACAPLPTPCFGQDACPVGEECLANRCSPVGGEPVAPDSARQVAEVLDLAIVAEHFDFGASLPQELTLGAERLGTTLVLMRFEPVWRRLAGISQAFLLVDPLPEGRVSLHDVEVELWRIDGEWSTREVSWHAQPPLAHPAAQGIARSGPLPLRMDVTRVIRYLMAHPRADHGLALRAPAGRGAGVRLASGMGGGHPPRLEIYHLAPHARASSARRGGDR